MKNSQNTSNWITGLLVLVVLALLFYWLYTKKETETITKSSETSEIHKHHEGEEVPIDSTFKAQHSLQNPLPYSSDPFMAHDDFEKLKRGNKNKTDFDFTFKGQEGVPTFKLENGRIDFELVGQLISSVDLGNKVPLSIEFYNNHQISLSRRKATYTYDLPFVKENEKVENDDDILYSFNFNMSMKLDPGIYYFLIAPTGRNRILHSDDFFVKR